MSTEWDVRVAVDGIMREAVWSLINENRSVQIERLAENGFSFEGLCDDQINGVLDVYIQFLRREHL